MLNNHNTPVINDINMTPLIDVMLVLLIVFMVTLPVLHHAVKLELPKAASAPQTPPPAPIDVSIDSAGAVQWNGVPADEAALGQHLQQTAALAEPPALQLYADQQTRYESVARVLSAAQRSGLSKIHLVTDPRR
jgi:biopolymer transport protein ExbD